MCPFVPLHSVTVTGSRGDRIRRARELRRLSREELAAQTGVNAKTIARIEREEVGSSPNLTVLEQHLDLTPEASPAGPASLSSIDDLDLIAELARRLAARRERNPDNPAKLGPEGHFAWYTADAPFPEPGPAATPGEEGVAGSGGPA
jgi:transcriptional regulator with XRE-family HTH domain